MSESILKKFLDFLPSVSQGRVNEIRENSKNNGTLRYYVVYCVVYYAVYYGKNEKRLLF